MAGYALKDLLARALALHRQGKSQEAAAHYSTILGRDPNHVDALHMLGVAHLQAGHYEKALQLISQALTIRQDPLALSNLGYVLNALKRHDEALRCCDQALTLQPHNAEALMNRGVALSSLKRYGKALSSFEEALALNPRYAEAFSNRGFALACLERFDEALASCERALALVPRSAETLNNRGIALAGLRRFDEALKSYEQALALKADYAEAWNNRGIALAETGRVREAIDSYDRALALRPDYADTHWNRLSALRDIKRFDEALASGERALRLDLGLPKLIGGYLSDKMHGCNWDDLESAYTNVIAAIDRGEKAANPFSLLPIPSTPAQQQRCARTYIGSRAPAAAIPGRQGERYRHDRIRIGYLSAEFHDHAIMHLLAELFERHDRSRFEVIAFSFGPPTSDPWRARLIKGFDRFLDVRQKSDREIAALVRALEIDIAIDLAGHTHGARTGVFALCPAPVQVNYLGYPGTMGASFIDYVIADPTVIPPEHHPYYDESVVYLPHSYQANDSTKRICESALARPELGLPEDVFVFCCFNSNHKITPDVFDIWMRLLHDIKESVFWLYAGNATAVKNLRAEAERRGIAGDRLIFAPRMALAEHLARHRAADLFLDTFYYNAHTTASDALWAGLPVLTCLGPAFAGRVAASLLTAIDMPELITRSHDEYESLARDLATHPESLATLRHKLAVNRGTQPLFDTPRFARHLEMAYLMMHDRHQAGLPPDHIVVKA